MKFNIIAKENGDIVSCISQNIAGSSKNDIIKQLKNREVKLNNIRVNKNDSVLTGDCIEVFFPKAMIDNIEVNVVFQDDNILIADKPAGMDVENNLVSILAAENKLFPVHRLDRNTVGLIVLAKTEPAYNILSDAFKKRTIDKFYYAHVGNCPPKESATLKAFLQKDSKKSFCTVSRNKVENSLPIITEYEVKEKREDGSALLMIKLVTGRTHQIRAHLAFEGFPIIGDGKYGDRIINERFGKKIQQLQSCKIKFNLLQDDLSYLNGKTFEIKPCF